MEIWKRNLYICSCATFIVSVGTSQLAPILPLYISDLGITDTDEVARWAGIIFSGNFLMLAIFSPIWGRLSDRYGRKRMALRASFWLAFVLAGMGLAQNVGHLTLLRLLQGALSGFQGACIPLIAQETPQEHSAWALSIYFTGQVTGALIGPLFGGWLSGFVGYRGSFFVMGGLCILGFLAILFVRETFQPTSARKQITWTAAAKSLRSPHLILGLFLTTLLVQFAIISIFPVLTLYVSELSDGGVPIALVAGCIFSASGFAGMISASRIGDLADHKGEARILFASLLLAALTLVLQGVARTPGELGCLRFCMGIATAGLLPVINALIRRYTPEEAFGRVYGVTQTFQFIGMFLGSILGGHIAATLNIPSLFFLSAALLLFNAFWCRAYLWNI